jgi:DNA-binding NtrC family response regulator
VSGYASTAGTRVLAIDDDPSMLGLLSHMLGSAGYSVEVAHEGAEGLAKIRAYLPDLVLCGRLRRARCRALGRRDCGAALRFADLT